MTVSITLDCQLYAATIERQRNRQKTLLAQSTGLLCHQDRDRQSLCKHSPASDTVSTARTWTLLCLRRLTNAPKPALTLTEPRVRSPRY